MAASFDPKVVNCCQCPSVSHYDRKSDTKKGLETQVAEVIAFPDTSGSFSQEEGFSILFNKFMYNPLDIPKIKYHISKQRTWLLKRVWNVISPYTKLVLGLLTLYIAKGIIVKGTLVGQLVETWISPLVTIVNSDINYEGPTITSTLVW